MIHSKSKTSVEPLTTEHGETIYELLGLACGEAKQHSVAHVELAPHTHSLAHYHPVAEESYYILSGQGRMVIADEQQMLTPGDCVFIPPGKTHIIYNDSGETLHFLAICTPAWDENCSVFD